LSMHSKGTRSPLLSNINVLHKLFTLLHPKLEASPHIGLRQNYNQTTWTVFLASSRPCWRNTNKRISSAAIVFVACFHPTWLPHLCLINLKELFSNHQFCGIQTSCTWIRLGRFTGFSRFYFQTGFFGLAFTKTGKPSLRNCLLSSPETRS
jgi:hypothetical protein